MAPDPRLSSPALPAAASADPLRLPVWRRVHVRLAGSFAVLSAFVLAIIAAGLYRTLVAQEVDALQQRLLTVVTALASSVDGEAVGAMPLAEDPGDPTYRDLRERFAEICRVDPDIKNIYLMRPAGEPGQFVFLIDYDVRGLETPPAAVGEPYDGREFPRMVEGLRRPAVEDEFYTDDWGPSLSGYAPVRGADGATVGLVGIDVHVRRLGAIRRDVLLLTGGLYGLLLVGVAGVASGLGLTIRRPLQRFIGVAEQVARGDLSARLALDQPDEFGLLSEHFDRMVAELQEREMVRETFGRFFSEEVARAILSTGARQGLGGEEREVTVLFCDLRNYTTIVERATPEQVVELLNAYLGEMQAAVEGWGGCVLEYVGDAVLAVFGAPAPLADHPERAVQCAREMQHRLRKLNERWDHSGQSALWRAQGVDALTMRVGVHTGVVVTGNFGSSRLMKYGVVGDVVNIASRLEGLNQELGTSILVSSEVYARLSPALAAGAVDQGEHVLKGRRRGQRVFSLGAGRGF